MEPIQEQESAEPKDLKYYISLINSTDAINHV